MNNLLQDLRFAFRQLCCSPAFAFTGITILTLAIAANVIVFGVLQGLILRPLDLPHPDRVMQLARTSQVYPVFGYPEVRDVRDDNTVFSSVAAYIMLPVGLEDTEKSVQVAVVNREFARELFHSDEVVGRYFKNESGHSIQILGIVGDGKHLRLNEDTEPAVFFPFSQWPDTNTSLIVRTRPDPSGAVTEEMTASIRKVISDLDSTVPIQQSGAWSDQLGLVLFSSRVATFALGLFGAFGLLLSVAGPVRRALRVDPAQLLREE